MRLADVIDADKLEGPAKSYALKAHLDFLVVDSETFMPRFAVELDGQRHWNDPEARRRDQLKDELCERASLPLLRITSDYLRRIGTEKALTYAVDAFYYAEAFDEAQQAGLIPPGEPFIIANTLVRDAQQRLTFNALDQEARIRMLSAYEAGRIPHYAPNAYHTFDAVAGAAETHAFMAVAPGRFLISQVRVREFRFLGIDPSEVSSQLAVAAIGDLVDRWLSGGAVARNANEMARVMRQIQVAIDNGGFLGCFTSDAVLRIGGPLPSNPTITVDSVMSNRVKNACKLL